MSRSTLKLTAVAGVLLFSCMESLICNADSFGPKVGQFSADGKVLVGSDWISAATRESDGTYTIKYKYSLSSRPDCYAFASPEVDAAGNKLLAAPTLPATQTQVNVRVEGAIDPEIAQALGGGSPPPGVSHGFILACVKSSSTSL